MKLKTIAFFTAFFLFALNVCGQVAPPKPGDQAPDKKTSTDDKKTSTVTKLPTVREILDKYVQALGGRANYEKIKTRSVTGSVELAPMNVKGTAIVHTAAPNKTYMKMTLAGLGDFFDAFDGTTAWTINPIQGNRVKSGEELLQTKLTADFYRDLNFEKLFSKLEVAGVEKIGEQEAYKIIATPAGLDPQMLFFDKATGLLVREDSTLVTPEGKIPNKNFYEDYRDVDGIKVPFKIRTVLPQYQVLVTVTEVKNNAAIDDKIFVKPTE